MVLHELHVFERGAGTISKRHAVTVLDVCVGGEGKNAATATCTQDHSLGRDRLDSAGHQLDGDDTLHTSVIDEKLSDKPLVVTGDGVELHRGLEKRVQHVKTGLVGSEPGATLLHPTECANGDVAVRLTVPGAAPTLELQ